MWISKFSRINKPSYLLGNFKCFEALSTENVSNLTDKTLNNTLFAIILKTGYYTVNFTRYRRYLITEYIVSIKKNWYFNKKVVSHKNHFHDESRTSNHAIIYCRWKTCNIVILKASKWNVIINNYYTQNCMKHVNC